MAQAFEAEKPNLMELPMDGYPVDARLEVSVAKTPYVRFDLNDYSIPHSHVQRTVTVLASADRVRVLDGGAVLAAHVEDLVQQKRGARQHRATSRLTQSVPAMADLLTSAAAKGHHLGSMTRVMGQMLGHTGWTPMTHCRDRPRIQRMAQATETDEDTK